MKIMYIEGSCWMRDKKGNLKPFNRSKGLTSLLTSFGDKLIYPEVYWYEGDYLFPYLEKILEEEKIDLIIGYSAGGYTGFHLCNKYKIKGIHFNPAIASTSEAPTLQLLPEDYKNIPIFNEQAMIIGERDRKYRGGVDGQLVIKYLESNGFKGNINIIPELEHSVPLELFEGAFKYYRELWWE